MKLVDNVLNWFATTRVWTSIARNVVGKMTFRVMGYPEFPLEKYFEIKAVLQQDPDALYAFVSADTESLAWKMTHMATSALWGHAGFIYLDGEHVRIKHMKGDGLNIWHVLDLLREVDNFAIVKLPFDAEALAAAKERLAQLDVAPDMEYDFPLALPDSIAGWTMKGLPVDVGQPLRFYCSEYVFVVGVGLSPDFQAHKRFGEQRFEPDHVFAVGTVVFLHASRKLSADLV